MHGISWGDLYKHPLALDRKPMENQSNYPTWVQLGLTEFSGLAGALSGRDDSKHLYHWASYLGMILTSLDQQSSAFSYSSTSTSSGLEPSQDHVHLGGRKEQGLCWQGWVRWPSLLSSWTSGIAPLPFPQSRLSLSFLLVLSVWLPGKRTIIQNGDGIATFRAKKRFILWQNPVKPSPKSVTS